jgi:hypothetical protein
LSYDQEIVEINWQCGAGVITRRFIGVDKSGNETVSTCLQTITIAAEHSYSMVFPADQVESICGSLFDQDLAAAAFDANTLTAGCDLLSLYINDRKYEASGDECYNIFRTFEVVNWCQFSGTDLSVANPFVVGRDEDRDGIPGNREVTVSFANVEQNNLYANYIVVSSGLSSRREGPISGSNLSFGPGYYQYTQVIAVYDQEAPELSINPEPVYCAFDCGGVAVEIPLTVTDNCTPDDLTLQAFVWPQGNEAAKFAVTASPAMVKSDILPVGEHKLELIAFDGCGNTNRLLRDLVIEDCKAPAPECLSGLIVELMPYDANGDGNIDDGRMSIHASEYLASETSDCNGPVRYSIHLNREPLIAGELNLLEQLEQWATDGGSDLQEVLDPEQSSIMVTCGDAGQTLAVIIAAWDAAGNGDYCKSFLVVQDNMEICTSAPGMSVAGLLSTENKQTVEQVTVSLSGHRSEQMISASNGAFSFGNLELGYDYTLTPLLDEDHDNGVSTFDLIEISKHILGVKPLNSPYKLIAADVDNNRAITALDLIQLRRLILSIDTEFAHNTSWRFVDASFRFPDPANPWASPFPEVINLNNLEGNIRNANFVAVKIGDVTLDARANSLSSGARNTAGTFRLEVADIAMNVGEEHTVAFRSAEPGKIGGYQFTLNLDPNLEFVDIRYGIAQEENFGTTHLDEGMLTTSWHTTTEDSHISNTSDVMFELVLRAKASVQLSEAIRISSRYTQAEAYATSGELMDVALRVIDPSEAVSQPVLFQNSPNPFATETVIGFLLPKAASATLTVRDITGKIIREIQGNFEKGYNSVVLDGRQLPGSGLMYYTLKSGDYTTTRKMIVVTP